MYETILNQLSIFKLLFIRPIYYKVNIDVVCTAEDLVLNQVPCCYDLL